MDKLLNYLLMFIIGIIIYKYLNRIEGINGEGIAQPEPEPEPDSVVDLAPEYASEEEKSYLDYFNLFQSWVWWAVQFPSKQLSVCGVSKLQQIVWGGLAYGVVTLYLRRGRQDAELLPLYAPAGLAPAVATVAITETAVRTAFNRNVFDADGNVRPYRWTIPLDRVSRFAVISFLDLLAGGRGRRGEWSQETDEDWNLVASGNSLSYEGTDFNIPPEITGRDYEYLLGYVDRGSEYGWGRDAQPGQAGSSLTVPINLPAFNEILKALNVIINTVSSGTDGGRRWIINSSTND